MGCAPFGLAGRRCCPASSAAGSSLRPWRRNSDAEGEEDCHRDLSKAIDNARSARQQGPHGAGAGEDDGVERPPWPGGGRPRQANGSVRKEKSAPSRPSRDDPPSVSEAHGVGISHCQSFGIPATNDPAIQNLAARESSDGTAVGNAYESNEASSDDDEVSQASGCATSDASPPGTPGTSRRERAMKSAIRRNKSFLESLDDSLSQALMVMISNSGNIFNYYVVKDTVLGEGSFGVVRRARVKATGAPRAVKCISKERIKTLVQTAKREIEIMNMVDHPNLVMLCEIFEDADCLYLVMELCVGGHLLERLEGEGPFSEAVVANLMQQILKALFYLHRNWICHRDVKAENCLLKSRFPIERNVVKVSDFGLSCTFRPKQVFTARVGTPSHMAPEVLDRRYTRRCDFWSCGVLLYHLLCGDLPFSDEDDAAEVKRGKVSFSARRWREVSEDALGLVRSFLVKKPTRRATPGFALQHKWFAKQIPGREEVPLKLKHVEKLRAFRFLNKLKRAALTVVATLLSDRDTLPARELFLTLDSDGDGLISIMELKAILLASRKFTVDPQDVHNSFDDLDSADWSLRPFGYTEFIAATFDRDRCLKDDVCRAAFRSFDKNGDGQISMAELAGGRMLGHLSLEELGQILQDLDQNGDNSIDDAEFLAMLRS